MVLFAFCVLNSKFKNIPSKSHRDNCDWIFQLVWFPQSLRDMFKPMTINSNKTSQWALQVELTSIGGRYYVDASKTKF